jgi:DnaK suppressor protein
MSDSIDLEVYKRKLRHLKKKLQVVEETSRAVARPVELDQSSVGRLSRMDAMQMQAMSLETQHRRSLQLKRIEGAFQRIEKDEYGYCLKCEEPISEKRLNFDPSVFLCIGCANQRES